MSRDGLSPQPNSAGGASTEDSRALTWESVPTTAIEQVLPMLELLYRQPTFTPSGLGTDEGRIRMAIDHGKHEVVVRLREVIASRRRTN